MRKARFKTILQFFLPSIFILGIVLLTRNSISEIIKKQTAKTFSYEYIPNQNIHLEKTKAFLQRDSIYIDFRKRFPYHYQTLGVASFPDSSILLIISEPPPYFERDSISKIFETFAYQVYDRKHPIGYDGFITDIMIVLGNATQENLNRRILKLSELLYLSSYKPYAMKLNTHERRTYFSRSQLDYQISLNEFHEWFFQNNEGFISLTDTHQVLTIDSLFDNKATGVFFSRIPGFIAWAIPKHQDIGSEIPHIRQFVLDADLILGAFADSSTLVIIGREREVPLTELPPLQVESVLLLASVTEKELSQSLDINDFLAGKMPNGKDWCPTYLSKELENTEFGHLMTITDILLKDWSENGSIQEAYYRYPKPRYYPFDKPLFRKLGLSELVYNWNTTDAMYAIDIENTTIYTLNRTGSLPVSYFNSQERSTSVGARYENQAYHYFATIGNTDLARVVQYTAIYQLFMDNGVTYSGNTYSAFPENKPYLLLQPTKEALNVFKNLEPNKITQFSDSVVMKSFDEFHRKQIEKQIVENETKYKFTYSEQQRQQIFQEIKLNIQQNIVTQFEEVKKMLNEISEEALTKLAKQLAYPRGTHVHNEETYRTYMRARRVNELVRTIGKNNLKWIGIDLNAIKDYYVRSLSTSGARYLKTPSVIITFNDFYTTGGHNLSSKISRVNRLSGYKHSRNIPQDYEKNKSLEPIESVKPEAQNSKPTSIKTKEKRIKTNKTQSTQGMHKTIEKPTQSAVRKTRSRNEVIANTSRKHRGF